MLSFLDNIDRDLYFFLNSFAGTKWFDTFNIILSSKMFGGVLLLAIIGLALKTFRGSGKRLLLAAVLSLSFTDSFTFFVLKQNIQRMRPCVTYEETAITPNGCKSQFGFPSNHAANSAAAATLVLAFGYKAFGLFLMGAAILVALSRVFLGVHYPFDVLVGLISGGLYSFLFVKMINSFPWWRPKKNDA
jgi:undecaprenyl-diphosphatase